MQGNVINRELTDAASCCTNTETKETNIIGRIKMFLTSRYTTLLNIAMSHISHNLHVRYTVTVKV